MVLDIQNTCTMYLLVFRLPTAAVLTSRLLWLLVSGKEFNFGVLLLAASQLSASKGWRQWRQVCLTAMRIVSNALCLPQNPTSSLILKTLVIFKFLFAQVKCFSL